MRCNGPGLLSGPTLYEGDWEASRRKHMATDKDKGLVGGAADIVGGATDGLRKPN